MRSIITFIVVLVVLLLVTGLLGGNVGPYELLLYVVIAFVAALLVRRRNIRPTA